MKAVKSHHFSTSSDIGLSSHVCDRPGICAKHKGLSIDSFCSLSFHFRLSACDHFHQCDFLHIFRFSIIPSSFLIYSGRTLSWHCTFFYLLLASSSLCSYHLPALRQHLLVPFQAKILAQAQKGGEPSPH